MKSDPKLHSQTSQEPPEAKRVYVPPMIEDSAEFEPLSMFCRPAFGPLPQCPDQSA